MEDIFRETDLFLNFGATFFRAWTYRTSECHHAKMLLRPQRIRIVLLDEVCKKKARKFSWKFSRVFFLIKGEVFSKKTLSKSYSLRHFWLVESVEQPIKIYQNSKFAKKAKIWFDEFFWKYLIFITKIYM